MMLEQLIKKRKQGGIGLLELMLSLAIIAILLIIATRYYLTANTEQRVNEALSMIKATRGSSAFWVKGRQNRYAGINMDQLNQFGLLPRDLVSNGGAGVGTNPWGGDITVAAATGQEGSTDNEIQVQLTQVPQAACRNLNQKLLNQGIVSANCLGAGGGTFSITF